MSNSSETLKSSQRIELIATKAQSRTDLWQTLLEEFNVKTMAEVGVYEGDFAIHMLMNCPAIEKYYMIDPWRHLSDWNKPANRQDAVFEKIYLDAIQKTDFAEQKRTVLRGKTTEVVESIPDNSLDFSYIDGDHTLKGITIDLVNIYPKIRTGGWIGGDDFSSTVWQHRTDYEPTLVFPYAVYFAEALGDHIYGLPFDQFLIKKQPNRSFSFIDLTDTYFNIGLRNQFQANKLLKLKIRELPTIPKKVLKQLKNRWSN